MKFLAQEILEKGSREEVRALFEFEDESVDEIYIKFCLWSRWAFPKFFPSKDAPFHREMHIKRIRLYLGYDNSFLNIAFRGSAKTTHAKLFRAFVIANDRLHRRRYLRVLSKDIANSKQTVTDVYNMLISPIMKNYYPEIFEKTEAKREETMAAFTTSTGVKMIADTIGTDQRGALAEDARPDFDWYDDFETRLSLMSAVTTHKIWQNMEEARTGLSKDGASEYTCNYISERGNVHKLVEKVRNKMIVPIIDNGEVAWDRYTKEDVERIKRETDDFEGEYLCKPSASKDVYFDRESIDRQKPKPIIDEIAGLKIFRRFNPTNRVTGGSDVGGGVGLDHSTAVYLDLDVFPVQVIATYKNNEVKPDAHAHVLAKQGKRFGECYLAPEKNYGSTIDILKTIYPTAMIHKTQRSSEKVKFVQATEYGWETNGATKPTMFADLDKAIQDGLIELNDPDLIAEARAYTTGDLMDRDPDPRMTTRHFDLLMALAIAWATRHFVKAKPKELDEWLTYSDKQGSANPAR
jgi:hypothetical protein